MTNQRDRYLRAESVPELDIPTLSPAAQATDRTRLLGPHAVYIVLKKNLNAQHLDNLVDLPNQGGKCQVGT